MAETITISLDPKTKQQLFDLSIQRNCSELQLAEQALRDFLDLQTWQNQAIRKGIEAADQGRLLSHSELKSRWESKLGTPLG